jgi:hypothetical protein
VKQYVYEFCVECVWISEKWCEYCDGLNVVCVRAEAVNGLGVIMG